MELTQASTSKFAGGHFAAAHNAAQVWHLTGNTPRRPVAPRAGEKVSLWFGISPAQSGLELYVVVENDCTDDLDEMPQIVKAAWKGDKNGSSYWHCEIGPFKEESTVAYFAVGNHRGREIICGHQHWFRVLSVYLEAEQFTTKEGDP